jgi:hypothetical protein
MVDYGVQTSGIPSFIEIKESPARKIFPKRIGESKRAVFE